MIVSPASLAEYFGLVLQLAKYNAFCVEYSSLAGCEVTNRNEDTDCLIDELLKGKTPEEILGAHGLIKHMTKRMVERALQAEFTAHLGYEPHERGPVPRDNTEMATAPRPS